MQIMGGEGKDAFGICLGSKHITYFFSQCRLKKENKALANITLIDCSKFYSSPMGHCKLQTYNGHM